MSKSKNEKRVEFLKLCMGKRNAITRDLVFKIAKENNIPIEKGSKKSDFCQHFVRKGLFMEVLKRAGLLKNKDKPIINSFE